MIKSIFAQKYIENKRSNFKNMSGYPEVFYKSKLRNFFYIIKSDIKIFNSHKHPQSIYSANRQILSHDIDCLISILESTLSYLKTIRPYVSK